MAPPSVCQREAADTADHSASVVFPLSPTSQSAKQFCATGIMMGSLVLERARPPAGTLLEADYSHALAYKRQTDS